MQRFQLPATLRTPRLKLREPRLADAPEIFLQYAADPEVCRYMTWRPHASVAETSEWLRHSISQRAAGVVWPYVIELADADALAGMIALRGVHVHGADVGYVLARRHWGRGYATEVVRAIIDAAFSNEILHRIWAVCDVENHGSARVLEKAGMMREGRLRKWLVHPNISDIPRDCWIYARIRDMTATEPTE